MDTGHSVVMVDFVKRQPAAGVGGVKADYRLIEPLTDRELLFLDHLAQGDSNKEIARSLCVSENTVKFHLKNVYSKFAVRTRLQAINAAYELGILPAQDQQRATAS